LVLACAVRHVAFFGATWKTGALDVSSGEVALKAANDKKKKQAAMLGLGLDNDDGHTRLTRGENFVLYGGSYETHAQMQETAIKVNEELDRRGQRLENVSLGELRDVFRKVNGQDDPQ
jgi:hypothetical protein